MTVALVLAWVAVALIGWVCFQLFVRYGRLLLRLEALERGLESLAGPASTAPSEPADPPQPPGAESDPDWAAPDGLPPFGVPFGTVLHDFELPDLDGRLHLRSHWLGTRFLMAFVNPACEHSRALVADLAALRTDSAPDWPRLMLVSTGPPAANRELFGETGLAGMVLLQEEMEVGSLFEVPATPTAYLVDEDGRTASPLVAGRAAILGLATAASVAAEESWALAPASPDAVQAVTSPAPVNGARYRDGGLGVGATAPDFRLPGLRDAEIALGDHRGRRVLLVFADPVSPPCQPLLPELDRLSAGQGGPVLMVVSRGGLAENRAWAERLGVSLPIGLQRRWDLSREYGILATPTAFLIDERGIIAKPVALGADAILALAAEIGPGPVPTS
jgi:peroxiredoxin